jgi:hypothetical protein
VRHYADFSEDTVAETTSKFRQLSGSARNVERVLLLGLTLVSSAWATQIHHPLPFAFFNEQFLGVFLGLSLASVFVAVKARPREAGDRVPALDWALSALGRLFDLVGLTLAAALFVWERAARGAAVSVSATAG